MVSAKSCFRSFPSIHLICTVVIIFIVTSQTLALDPPINGINKFCYNDNGNYSDDSPYQKNLNVMLASLVNNGNGTGFYSSSGPSGPNPGDGIVYATGICRGDTKVDACGKCITDATYTLTKDCPVQKEALGCFDNCTLRYSNRSLYGLMESYPRLITYNTDNVTVAVDDFIRRLMILLELLTGEAASRGDKFSTGSLKAFEANRTIYAHAQCTPDLSEIDCRKCLNGSIASMKGNYGCIGGRVCAPSCNFRFELYQFFDQPREPLLLAEPPKTSSMTNITFTGKKKSKRPLRVVIVIIVPIVVSLALIISICLYLRMRKTKEKLADGIGSADALQFDFGSIKVATNNFADENKLGRGGFGVVYKGRLLNREHIAVKRLSSDSKQGDLEFKNEVLLVAKLQHRNLVKLLGFSLEGNERLLVYEFLSNASLDKFIFDPAKRSHLNWDGRYKIILGIARGLLYLHEDSRLRIIHRDLKASNILLDAEMNPKIADFGMAKLFMLGQGQGETHRIVGTYGYMAPEYAMRGQFSIKSDVYSFGVLLLEIVSGQKINSSHHDESDQEDLVSCAWRNLREGTTSNLIDSALTGAVATITEITRCIHIGLLCLQQSVVDRPTMPSVIQMLTGGDSPTLPRPSTPAFFVINRQTQLGRLEGAMG